MSASESASGTESDDREEKRGCGYCFEDKRKHDTGFVDDTAEPGYKQHKCTDIPCLLAFAGALVVLAWIWHYSYVHGDLRRLYHGYDFLGDLCGLDNGPNGTDNTQKKVLFWCTAQSGIGLDLEHPICRESCPSGNLSHHPCYDNTVTGKRHNLGDEVGSFQRTVQYLFREVKDYQTKPLMGVYCYPTDNALQAQLMAHLRDDPTTKMLAEAVSLHNAWMIVAGSAALALLLGFGYVFLLDKCAKCLVYMSMAVLCVAPMVFGGIFIYGYVDGSGLDGFPSTGDKQYDLYLGLACVVLGLVFTCVCYCASGAIETAYRVVQAASEALMDMPTLLLEPLITQTIRLVVFVAMMYGLLYLLSCGKISTLTLEEYAALPGATIQGLFRTFTYSENEWYYIVFYGFMIIWIMCLCTAAAQFALAYAVQRWYFTPVVDGDKDGVPGCPILEGYGIGYFYHLGSFAFGSFLIASLLLVRIVLGFLAKHSKSQGNAVLAIVAGACQCCLHCFQRCLEFLNKNAYMDIALNSFGFCFGARNAFKIITKNFPTIMILNGAFWIFQLAGVGAITGIGSGVVYLVLRNVPYFSDPSSEHYVNEPLVILGLAALVCFMVSYAFMMVYDMVADTILYCYYNEMLRKNRGTLSKETQYAPRGLNELVKEGA